MFSSAILKLTAFCNLNCTYCYMFNLEDHTYRKVPQVMSLAVAIKVLERVERHLAAYGRKRFSFILHGGEPTLWPLANFSEFLKGVSKLREKYEIELTIQTNAYQAFDKRLLELFNTYGVSVGISLDGPPQYNDLYRVDHKGCGSYNRIIGNVQKIVEQGYEHLIGGFLTVAQPDIPPQLFLEWMKTLPVKRVSVLWPIEYNYDNPPWQQQSQNEYKQIPRYGFWFTELFIAWLRQDDPELYIRHFYDILYRLMGIKRHTDSIGNDLIDMFVVNTDGGIEYPDYFRSYKDGGSRTPYNVHENDLSEVIEAPIFSYCLNLRSCLPAECQECPHVDVCGGGFLPGRMTQDEAVPTRKSILCADQFYFFSHVQDIVSSYLSKQSASTRLGIAGTGAAH